MTIYLNDLFVNIRLCKVNSMDFTWSISNLKAWDRENSKVTLPRGCAYGDRRDVQSFFITYYNSLLVSSLYHTRCIACCHMQSLKHIRSFQFTNIRWIATVSRIKHTFFVMAIKVFYNLALHPRLALFSYPCIFS